MTRPVRDRRPFKAHALMLGVTVLAVAAAIAGAYATIFALYMPACVGEASEATIVAPDSARGRLLCTISDDGDLGDNPLLVYLPAAATLLLAVVALILWFTRRRRVLIAAALLAALAAPWAGLALGTSLSPNCTTGQWARYGPSGCERDEELRPGFAQY